MPRPFTGHKLTVCSQTAHLVEGPLRAFMSSKVLLNLQAPPRTLVRNWRQPQRSVCAGIGVGRRIRQRPLSGRTGHACAALELQQSDDVSTGCLQDAAVAPGAAVEVSHVSMAFGDRQVCLVTCCSESLSSYVLVVHFPPQDVHCTSMQCAGSAPSLPCRFSLTSLLRSLGAHSTCSLDQMDAGSPPY